MASDLSLDEYVAREDRYERTGKLDPAPSAAGPIPPPPIPGQLPSPPGTSGFGPVGQTVYDAFQPEPPGTDPFSVHPADLWRQLRQGILSDDDIAEIKRNPKSPRSVAALAQGAIMLSRGAGEGEHLNWRIVPGEEWNKMKVVQEPMVADNGEVIRPSIRKDDAGNQFEYQGSHRQGDEHNIIAKPVPPRTAQDVLDDLKSGKIGPPKGSGPEPGSPEWFKAKSDAFQKKNFPGAQDLGATGSNPVQKWDELAPEVQRWFKDQYGHDSDASAEKHWNDTLPDTAKENKSQMSLEDQVDAWKHFVFEEKGSPENMPPEVKKAIMDGADTPEDFAKLFKALHPEAGPESPNEKPDLGFKPKPGEEGPNLLTPGEQVGPVDWNWYKPQGGSNPPYDPPFNDSPGWQPPVDPNSPDFPGFNRWDYQPPPN